MNTHVNDGSFVQGVGDDGDKSFRLLGFQLYVIKCKTGEECEDDPSLRHIGGIILPNSDRVVWANASETCTWVEILGWGPRCTLPWKKGLRVHVRGHFRTMDPRIKRSPYRKSEYFIDGKELTKLGRNKVILPNGKELEFKSEDDRDMYYEQEDINGLFDLQEST